MAKPNEKQTEKKPPFHEVAMAILAGKYDKVLLKLGLGSEDCFTITCLAFLASQCYIPEKAKPKLTAAIISSIKTYGDDNDICQAWAMAIASMGTAYLVEEAIAGDAELPPGQRMNDDELENLLTLDHAISIIDIKELFRGQTAVEKK